MVILGIDPGIGRTGWGVVEVQSSKFKVLSYGCFETQPKSPMDERLALLFGHMEKIIAEHKPDSMAVEELFFNTNTTTALTVGHARGVIILSAALKKIPTFSYTPLQVKMAVTGYGRAEKNQVGDMIKLILHLKSIPKPDDTADALAVAITHAFSAKMPRK